LRLPEAYRAAITIPIVVQSPSTAMSVSAQYFAGTAAGGAVGFPGNVFAFGACILAIGLVFAPFRVERSAYRYAGITLAIALGFGNQRDLPRTSRGVTRAVQAISVSAEVRARGDREPGLV
jgi:hypothetical protein